MEILQGKRAGRKCLGLIAPAISLALLARLAPPMVAAAQSPEPTPAGAPTPIGLPKPTLPPNPSQADHGAQLYWFTCMACHGDRGQGLTDEWRLAFGPEDSNCWQSKCHASVTAQASTLAAPSPARGMSRRGRRPEQSHASNHPADGFELPRAIPAVVGPGTLARYATAKDLYDYILATMPWWSPGSLSADDAWILTAYLMRERGELPQGLALDPTSASAVRLNAPAGAAANPRPLAVVVAIALVAAGAGLCLYGRETRRGRGPSATPPAAAPRRTPQPQPGRRPSFFHHLHPPTIPAGQARWRYTLGAGGIPPRQPRQRPN